MKQQLPVHGHSQAASPFEELTDWFDAANTDPEVLLKGWTKLNRLMRMDGAIKADLKRTADPPERVLLLRRVCEWLVANSKGVDLDSERFVTVMATGMKTLLDARILPCDQPLVTGACIDLLARLAHAPRWNSQAMGNACTALKAMLEAKSIAANAAGLLPVCDVLLDQLLGGKIIDWESHGLSMTSGGLRAMLMHGVVDTDPIGLQRLRDACRWLLEQAADKRIKGWNAQHVSNLWSAVKTFLDKLVVTGDDARLLSACDRLMAEQLGGAITDWKPVNLSQAANGMRAMLENGVIGVDLKTRQSVLSAVGIQDAAAIATWSDAQLDSRLDKLVAQATAQPGSPRHAAAVRLLRVHKSCRWLLAQMQDDKVTGWEARNLGNLSTFIKAATEAGVLPADGNAVKTACGWLLRTVAKAKGWDTQALANVWAGLKQMLDLGLVRRNDPLAVAACDRLLEEGLRGAIDSWMPEGISQAAGGLRTVQGPDLVDLKANEQQLLGQAGIAAKPPIHGWTTSELGKRVDDLARIRHRSGGQVDPRRDAALRLLRYHASCRSLLDAIAKAQSQRWSPRMAAGMWIHLKWMLETGIVAKDSPAFGAACDCLLTKVADDKAGPMDASVAGAMWTGVKLAADHTPNGKGNQRLVAAGDRLMEATLRARPAPTEVDDLSQTFNGLRAVMKAQVIASNREAERSALSAAGITLNRPVCQWTRKQVTDRLDQLEKQRAARKEAVPGLDSAIRLLRFHACCRWALAKVAEGGSGWSEVHRINLWTSVKAMLEYGVVSQDDPDLKKASALLARQDAETTPRDARAASATWAGARALIEQGVPPKNKPSVQAMCERLMKATLDGSLAAPDSRYVSQMANTLRSMLLKNFAEGDALALLHDSVRWVLRKLSSGGLEGCDAVQLANLWSFVKVVAERGIVARKDIEFRKACAWLADKVGDEAVGPWDGQALANVSTGITAALGHGLLERNDRRVVRARGRMAREMSDERTQGFDTQAIGDIFNCLSADMPGGPGGESDQPVLDACDRLLRLSLDQPGTDWFAHDVAGAFKGLSALLERQFGGPGEGKREALKKYLLDKHPSGQWNEKDLEQIGKALAAQQDKLRAEGRSDPTLDQAIRLLRIHRSFRALLRHVIDCDVHDWGPWVLASVWKGVDAMLKCGVIATDHPLLDRACDRLGVLGNSLAPPWDAPVAGTVWCAVSTLATHGGRGPKDDRIRRTRDRLMRLMVDKKGIQGWDVASAAASWDGMRELLLQGGMNLRENLPRLAFQHLMELSTANLPGTWDRRTLASQAAGVSALLGQGFMEPGEPGGRDAAAGVLVLQQNCRWLLGKMMDESIAWDAPGLAAMWNTVQAMLTHEVVAADDDRMIRACERLLRLSDGEAIADPDAAAAAFGGIQAMLDMGVPVEDAAALDATCDRAISAALHVDLAGWSRACLTGVWRAIDTALRQGVLGEKSLGKLEPLALRSLHRLDSLTRKVTLSAPDRQAVAHLSRWLRRITKADPAGIPPWPEETGADLPDDPELPPAQLGTTVDEVMAVSRRFEKGDRYDASPAQRLSVVNELLNRAGASRSKDAFKAILGGETRHDPIKLANQLWTGLKRANQYLDELAQAAAGGKQAEHMRGAWTIAQQFTGARAFAEHRRQLAVLAQDPRCEYTEQALDQELGRFTGNLMGALASILAGTGAEVAKWFGNDHSATIILGLATLVEAGAIDLDAAAGPFGAGQERLSNRLVIQRFIGAMAAHSSQDQDVRATSNGVGALGKLLDRDAALGRTSEAKAAARNFIRDISRNAPSMRNGPTFVQVFAGMHRLETARVLRLDEGPPLEAARAALRQLTAVLAADSESQQEAPSAWDGVELSTTLSWLGRLLASSPGLAELPEAKAAADAIVGRFASHLRSETETLDLFSCSQALAGLHGLDRAGLLDLDSFGADFDILLTQLSTWKGGATDRITSMALASLAGLMLGNQPLAESARAWKAAEKLVDVLMGSAGLEPFDYSWTLLGLHRLQLVRANTHAGKSAGLDLGAAVSLMLQHIATAAPKSWHLANLFVTWRTLHDCVMNYNLVAINDQTVGQAACTLVTATFSGVLDTAGNRHMGPVLRALDAFCRVEVPPAAVWKEAAQALLVRAQQSSFEDAPVAALNTLSLLRFVLGKGLLDRPEEGWAAYAKLWDRCVQQPPHDMAYLARLLNEGSFVDRDWGQHWPAHDNLVSPLGDKSSWREQLVNLAQGCEGLADQATLEQRMDLRQLCISLERLRHAVPKGGTYHQMLGKLQAEHTVRKLNELLTAQLDALQDADEFPFTALELTLVRKYLDITHTPRVRLMSEDECKRIIAQAHDRLRGKPTLARPRTQDQAFGIAHVSTTGQPIRTRQAKQGGPQTDPIRWRAISTFQELFGSEVPAPIIVHMRRGDGPDDLPAFISYRNVWYRTDLFRGSANRGGDGQYPRMIAIPMSVAPLFVQFYALSQEARCYLQRLFLPEGEFAPVSLEDIEFSQTLEWLEMERLWDALESLGLEDGDLEHEALDSLLLDEGLVPQDWRQPDGPIATEDVQTPTATPAGGPLAKYLNTPVSDVPRVLSGKFNVAYVADSRAAELFPLLPGDGYEHLKSRDGCGFIHEDLFAELMKEPMPGVEGSRMTTPAQMPARMMFPATALQHYKFDADKDRDVVHEIVDEARRNLRGRQWSKEIDLTEDVSLKKGEKFDSPLFRIMTTGMPATCFGTAVPVKGNKLLLPKTPFWEKFVQDNCPFFLGRHPFDTRQLQIITRDDIDFVPALNGIAAQYSLNGIVAQDGGHATHGAKGLLQVIPRAHWPTGNLAKCRLLLSAKDLKAGNELIDHPAKLALQKGAGPGFEDGMREVEMHGVLVLKELRANLVGTPDDLMEELAGDFDGDHVLLTAARHLVKLLALVGEQHSLRNSKLTKTFTKERSQAGAYIVEKVVQLMTGNLVEDAGTHSMRFNSLGMGPVRSAWDYLRGGATSLDDMLDRSLYGVLYHGRGVDELRQAAPHVDFEELSRGIEPPATFAFDVGNRRHLAALLGLQGEFDPDNDEHVWAFIGRELNLLTKAATDQEKMNLDYDAVDRRRNEYAKALNSDPRVPGGVPYGKSLMNRIAALRTYKHDPVKIADEVKASLMNAFERSAFHAGLPAAVLRETTRWFLDLPGDAALLVKAAGQRHAAQDPADNEKAEAKDAALAAALLSGQSVDFDPENEDREAVTQALTLAAAGGKARMLDEILNSPLGLTLREFDPEHGALQAALKAGHADCVTILLDHVRAEAGGAGLSQLEDLLAQYDLPKAQRPSLEAQALDEAASRLRRAFKPLQPQIQPLARTARVFEGRWEKSQLGKIFTGYRGKPATPASARELAQAVVEHPGDLQFASKQELTWLLNIVAGGTGVSNALTVLSERICAEPAGWTSLSVAVRISALARHLDVPACREAFVRMAAAMPAILDESKGPDLRVRLAQLGGGLGHAHELVKHGVLPPASAKHITDAVAALANWICDNADKLDALDKRALSHTINGLSRYRVLVPECAPAIRQLADLVRRTTQEDWSDGRDAALHLSSLLHGLVEFTSDETCRQAVLHVAPAVERLGRQHRAGVAADPVDRPREPVPASPAIGDIALSNMVLGLGTHLAPASDPEPLVKAIKSLAGLLAAQSPVQLAKFAPSSLRKIVGQLAPLRDESSDEELAGLCGTVLAKVVKALGTAKLDAWTAAELMSVRDSLKLAPMSDSEAAKAVDRLRSRLDGMTEIDPRALAGMTPDQLLASLKRLDGHAGAGQTIARVKKALGDQVHGLAPAESSTTARATAPKERPVSVVETGEPLFSIRKLRTPQKQSIPQHHIPIGQQAHLEKYLLGLHGPGQFWRGATRRKVLDFHDAIQPGKRYLYTIDAEGVKLALEDGKNEVPARRHGNAGLPTRHLHHTNLSEAACIGGEVWFSADGTTVTLNADSGRFGIEYNPKANEILGTLTQLQWENTIRLWESFGFTVKPAQRVFTSESIANLVPLVQGIDLTSESQLERIAGSMEHAKLRFEAGDAGRLAQVLQALSRLPGVANASSQGPLDDAGVGLAHRAIGMLATTIRRDQQLKFSPADVQAVRQALESLANEKLGFACKNLLALVEDHGPARVPAASGAQASVKPSRPALPAASTQPTPSSAGAAPAKTVQFQQLSGAQKKEQASRLAVLRGCAHSALVTQLAGLQLAQPNPLQLANASDLLRFLQLARALPKPASRAQIGQATKAIQAVASAVEAKSNDFPVDTATRLLAELGRTWRMDALRDCRDGLGGPIRALCRQLAAKPQTWNDQLNRICDVVCGSAVLAATDAETSRFLASIAQTLKAPRKRPPLSTFTYSRFGELLQGLDEANVPELTAQLVQCFAAVKPNEAAGVRLLAFAEFAERHARRCRLMPEEDMRDLIEKFMNGLGGLPLFTRPVGRFVDDVCGFIAPGWTAPNGLFSPPTDASERLVSRVLGKQSMQEGLEILLGLSMRELANSPRFDLSRERARIALGWHSSRPAEGLAIALARLGNLPPQTFLACLEEWADAVAEAMEFPHDVVAAALHRMSESERASLRERLARVTAPTQDAQDLAALIDTLAAKDTGSGLGGQTQEPPPDAGREIAGRVDKFEADLRARLTSGQATNDDIRELTVLLGESRAEQVPPQARGKALEALSRLAIEVAKVARKSTLLTLARELCRSVPDVSVEGALATLAPYLDEQLGRAVLGNPAEIAATAGYLPAALRSPARPAALVIACVAANGIVRQGAQAFDSEQRAGLLAMLQTAQAGSVPQHQQRALGLAVQALSAPGQTDDAASILASRIGRLEARLVEATVDDPLGNGDVQELCLLLRELRRQQTGDAVRRRALQVLAEAAMRLHSIAQTTTLLTLARELCFAVPDENAERALQTLAPHLEEQAGKAVLGRPEEIAEMARLMPASLQGAARPAALVLVCAGARGIARQGVASLDEEQRQRVTAMLQAARAGNLSASQERAIGQALQALGNTDGGALPYESLDALQDELAAVSAADDAAPDALRAITTRLQATNFDDAVPAFVLHELLLLLCKLLPLNSGAAALDVCGALIQAMGRNGVANDESAPAALTVLLADFGELFTQQPPAGGLHEVFTALAGHIGIGADQGHEPWTFDGRLALLAWLLEHTPATNVPPDAGANLAPLRHAAGALSELAGLDDPQALSAAAQAARALVQALDAKTLAWLATGTNAAELLPHLDPDVAALVLAEVIANAASPLDRRALNDGVWHLVRQLVVLSQPGTDSPDRQQWGDADRRLELLHVLLAASSPEVDLELHSDRLNLHIGIAAQRAGRPVRVRSPQEGTPVASLYGILSRLAKSKPQLGTQAQALAGALITAVCNATRDWKASRKDAQDLMTVLLADFPELLDREAPPNGLDVLWSQLAITAGLPESLAADWSQRDAMLEWLVRLPAPNATAMGNWFEAFEKTFETDAGTGCSISIRPQPYEDVEGNRLEHRVRLVVPPREITRATGLRVKPDVLKVFHAPWLAGGNKGPHYQEAQTNAECGLHTLNGMNAGLRNNDPSFLVTRSILNDFIYRTLKKEYDERVDLTGEERATALRSAYRQATTEYGLEWLVRFNNQHGDGGFPKLRAFEELTLDEQGSLRVNEPAREELARIADHNQIGLVFAFHREGRTESLSPHIVLLERRGGQIVMRDSRPHGQEIGPYVLEGATMGEAIEDAVRKFGVPHWTDKFAVLVDDLPSAGSGEAAREAANRALDRFAQSLHTVLQNQHAAMAILKELQALRNAVSDADPQSAAALKQQFKQVTVPRLIQELPELRRYVGFISVAPAEPAVPQAPQAGVQQPAHGEPPALIDLDAACDAVSWYQDHGRAGELGDLIGQLDALPAGAFTVDKLEKMARTVAAGDGLATSARLRGFMIALAKRTAQLVSQGTITAWLNPKSGLLNILVACLGTVDYAPSDPVLADIRELIDTLYLRCNDKPDPGWADSWSKVKLATRAARCRYIYGQYKNSWVQAGGAKVPTAATDPRIVSMLGEMLAGDFKVLCMVLASPTPPSENLVDALSRAPMAIDFDHLDFPALKNLLACSRPWSAKENEIVVRMADRINLAIYGGAMVFGNSSRRSKQSPPLFMKAASEELPAILDMRWGHLDNANQDDGITMLVAAAIAAHCCYCEALSNPQALAWGSIVSHEKVATELGGELERCKWLLDARTTPQGKPRTIRLRNLPPEMIRRMGRAYFSDPEWRKQGRALDGTATEIALFNEQRRGG